MRQRPGIRFKTKKERIECERNFLNSVLASLETADMRRVTAMYPDVSWRRFCDRRHQALWRALQTLDLKSAEERMDVLMLEWAEEDAGEPGSARAKRFKEKLIERSSGPAWLERELEAAGALSLVGGKIYLRELCRDEGRGIFISHLGQQLGFYRKT